MVSGSVAIAINTYRDDPEQLVRAIESHLGQVSPTGAFRDVHVFLSTVEGDPSIDLVGTGRYRGHPRVTVSVTARSDHPGRGPAGIYRQLNNTVERILRERVERGIEWFAYASGNDEALPTKLDDEVGLCRHEGKLVCYSDFYAVSEETGAREWRRFDSYDMGKHLKENFVSDCALMHLSILDAYRPFRERFRNHAFWDFWLRVHEGAGDVFIHNPRPEWLYHVSESSQHVRRQRSRLKEAANTAHRYYMLSHHRRRRWG